MAERARKSGRRPTPRRTDADLEREEEVSLFGGFAQSITQIRASALRLITTYGIGDHDRDVLVPLIDLQLYGTKAPSEEDVGPDDPGQSLVSYVVSFDNAAFLLQDMAFDLRDAIRLLTQQPKGGITPQAQRMRYAVRMLRQATAHLAAAAEGLEAHFLADEGHSEETGGGEARGA